MAVSLPPHAESVPLRRSRMHEEERRARLIDAAEAVFLERGFRAATMDDIAHQAGMSKKTVYQVFAAKAALFEALLRNRFSIYTVTIEDDDRPLCAVLAETLFCWVMHATSGRQIAILRLMIAETPRSPEIAAALDRMGVGKGDRGLEKWLTAKTIEGALEVENPEETAARLFWGAAGEFVMQALLNKDPPVTPTAVRRRVDQVVGAFLHETKGCLGTRAAPA